MTVNAVTIAEVATRLGVKPDTLRWFERHGVVPPPARTGAGHRRYADEDIHLLEVLLHLRRTGMPLAEITEFTSWVQRDPDGVTERLHLLHRHQERVARTLEELSAAQAVIARKITDYQARC
ncbi:MAG: MerR family transcriptional regulator [Pseudonocardia sp.]|nr:MerR family transcriptional regulator [Pseudonocardia sp.]